MGGSLATGLQFFRPSSGAAAPEAMEAAEIHASSRGLGWNGVVAERGITRAWDHEDLAATGHLVILHLGTAPLRVESRRRGAYRPRLVSPGSLSIVSAGTPSPTRLLEPIVWGAVEISAEKAREAIGRDIEPMADTGTLDQKLAALVRSLLLEAEAGGPSGPMLVEELTLALAARLATHSPGRARTRATRGGIGAERLNRVTEMIEGTMASAITVEGLAAVAGLSPAHFARAFKRETRETPHAFVMRRRIERARELMASGSSIADAALGCGFADQAHLSRVFKLRFGMTPGAFVRSARGKL